MKLTETFLKGNLQLIEVKTKNIMDTKGMLYLYERKTTGDQFILQDSFDVVIGRSGFAWDHQSPFKFGSQRVKHEGDGCSPAGIFTLGFVFSYHEMEKINMPFMQMDEHDLCVDDANSIYYNQHVRDDSIQISNYNSFEKMKRDDALYEYGVWVNYNTVNTMPGSGSCIFLHVWLDENTPTSGCTAMSREHILKLINWLDAEKNPVLLQYAGF